MELYFKNKNGQLEQTNLIKELNKQLLKADFKTENGSFENDNYTWIGVIQEKNKKQVTINLGFESNGNTILDVNCFVADIKKVVDEENQIKLC